MLMNKFNYELIYKIIFLLILNLTITNIAASKHLPQHKPVPGGIAIIPLDVESLSFPVVFFNDKRVLVIKHQDAKYEQAHNRLHWLAIIGISMDTKPGLHKIQIFLDQINHHNFSSNIEKSFLVSNKKYPSEQLKLSSKFVNPSLADQMRINQEKELINKAYNHWSQSIPNLLLQQPTIGRKSSNFGLKRILNGQHKGFHTGLDLAASLGAKVYAAASGKVILTGNFFYTGNVVFIDHGQGLITNYCHLDSIAVNEGDLVNNQSVIGTVGASGRATGAHLHWSVSLNDARINPELFLPSN
jgi:murein DD-endopeptidase MepM/ murein hydrolase activator NlpD